MDRVADRRRDGNRPEFTGAARLVVTWDEVDIDRRRFPQMQRLERIEVRLHRPATIEGDLRLDGGESPHGAAFDIRCGDTWIKKAAAIRCQCQPTDLHL